MITAADIVKRHGHDLAWFQTHYGSQHLGKPGQYLFTICVVALIVMVIIALAKRAARS